MRLTQVIKQKNEVKALYNLVYPRISEKGKARIKEEYGTWLPVSDVCFTYLVSSFKSRIDKDLGCVTTNLVDGAYAEIEKMVPGAFRRIAHKENAILSKFLDAIFFTEKFIESAGRSIKLKCVDTDYRTLRLIYDVEILVYNVSYLLDGRLSGENVESIDRFIIRYKPELNDNYKRCLEFLDQVCKESIYYILLTYVKSVSEKSCAYLMDNLHLMDKGGSIFDHFKNKSRIFSKIAYTLKYKPHSDLKRDYNLSRLLKGKSKLKLSDTSFIKSFEDKYVPVDSPYDKEW